MIPANIPPWFAQAYLACDMYPTYFFEHRQQTAWKIRRQRFSSYSLYVILSGSLRCMVQDKVLSVGPGEALLLPLGVTWLEDGGIEGGGTHLLIADILVKAGATMDPLVRLPLPIACRPDPAAVRFAQSVAEGLKFLGRAEVIRRCKEGNLFELRAATAVLMDAVVKSIFSDPNLVVAPDAWPPAVHAAWTCIERSPLDARLNLSSIAKAAKVSPSRLAALFQEYFHDSPWNMVIKRRLVHAQTILRDEPHLTIAEVAKRCGWKDPKWFRRVYQRQFGENPKRGAQEGRAPARPK